MSDGQGYETSVLERIWGESLAEGDAKVDELEQAVRLHYPLGRLTVERYKVVVTQIEGRPGFSIVAEVRSVAEHTEHGRIEVFEQVPLFADDARRGLEDIAHTVLETTVEGLRAFLGDHGATVLGLELTSETPNVGATNWEVAMSPPRFVPSGHWEDTEFVDLVKRAALSALTPALGTVGIHWIIWSLTHHGGGRGFGECVIDGEDSEEGLRALQAVGDAMDERLKDAWNVRQFIIVRPDGEADSQVAEELRAYRVREEAGGSDLSQAYHRRQDRAFEASFAQIEFASSTGESWRDRMLEGGMSPDNERASRLGANVKLSSWRYSWNSPVARFLCKVMGGAVLAGLICGRLGSTLGIFISLGIALGAFALWRRVIVVVKEGFEKGLLTPGVIVDTDPVQIVVMAPLAWSPAAPNRGLALKLLMPKRLPVHDHRLGERVPCFSTFRRPEGSSHYWKNFDPDPISWGTGEQQEIERCTAKIDPADFALLEKKVKEGYYPRETMRLQRLEDEDQTTEHFSASVNKVSFASRYLYSLLGEGSRAEFLDTLAHEKGGAKMMRYLWENYGDQLGESLSKPNGINGHVYRHDDHLIAVMMMPQPTVLTEPAYVAALVGPMGATPWSRDAIDNAPLRYFFAFPANETQLEAVEYRESDEAIRPAGILIEATVSAYLDWVERQTEEEASSAS